MPARTFLLPPRFHQLNKPGEDESIDETHTWTTGQCFRMGVMITLMVVLTKTIVIALIGKGDGKTV